MKSAKLCRGCRDDFYNGNNDMGIKECWSLRQAAPVTRYACGTWTQPAVPGAFREVKVYSCYRPEDGSGISHCDELPECATEVQK